MLASFTLVARALPTGDCTATVILEIYPHDSQPTPRHVPFTVTPWAATGSASTAETSRGSAGLVREGLSKHVISFQVSAREAQLRISGIRSVANDIIFFLSRDSRRAVAYFVPSFYPPIMAKPSMRILIAKNEPRNNPI